MRASKERIFGKKKIPTVNNSDVNNLEFEDENVHTINTRENNYSRNPSKEKFNKNNSTLPSTPK